MTPFCSASGTWGTGMPTGVAPSAASIFVVCRVGARTFMPFRSARCTIGFLIMWNTPPPCR